MQRSRETNDEPEPLLKNTQTTSSLVQSSRYHCSCKRIFLITITIALLVLAYHVNRDFFRFKFMALTAVETFLDVPNVHYVKPNGTLMQEFRSNYRQIRSEFEKFDEVYHSCTQPFDSIVKGTGFGKQGWKAHVLRIYGQDTEIMNSFPLLRELINSNKFTISFAMFSIFESGTQLPPHYGIFGGVYRYQLALKVPPADKNNLYLKMFAGDCGGVLEAIPRATGRFQNEDVVFHWNEGEDFFFDDTCQHEARNLSNGTRVILFLDVARWDLKHWYQDWFNKIFLSWISAHISKVTDAVKVQNEIIQNCKAMRRHLDNPTVEIF